MPILESLEPPTTFGGKSSSPKSPVTSVPTSPMDLLKNPFLLPAHLLALNPNLYAAQLAQLQAAQLLFAKQQTEAGDRNGGPSSADRKRSLEEDSANSAGGLGSKAAKYPRSSSPIDGRKEPNSESPLDLSGNKSPDCKSDSNPFNPLLPQNILSFFNQMKQPSQPNSDLTGLAGGLINFPARPKVSPGPASPPSRSPWQSQWISKTSESTRIEDVFKCVWCKESYHSLDQLTKHMREAKHHNLPQYGLPIRPPVSSPVRPSLPLSAPSLPSPPRQERDVLREQMPIPRKLVRGQDVWIGRADEQTRDILKCMGCGESFRTLDLLTKHMQATQHYKKVISHDQISTWKYPESPAAASKSPVNSVLSCKVCDKGFSSLKELSDHMVRNSHYAGPGETKLARAPPQPSAAQQSRDRKKSLPVKKLLELERARQEVAGNKSPVSAKEIMESGKLMCERCEEKIPIDIFIPHIQQCVGRPRFLKAPNMETASSQSGNKESKVGSKSETKEGNSEGSSDSILGSLEQLVKGNFTASASSKILPPISSPAAQSSPLGKFNINSLFPLASSASSPPSSPGTASSHNSKPASPSNNNTNILQASLEKMLDSPVEKMRSSPSNGLDRQAGSPESEKPGSSPGAEKEEEKHIPQVAAEERKAGDSQGSKDGGNNALAALQNFCNDQTKSAKPTVKETTVASSGSSPMSDPGAILAFSWAVNQAGNSTDSAIKCPFCDTPFISKGAYRHHLSKMHFNTKENLGNISTPNIPQVANLNSRSGASSNRTPSPEAKDAEESLQSKYLKYSQLAKQLSCYDGTN